jgi:hypothetical protein
MPLPGVSGAVGILGFKLPEGNVRPRNIGHQTAVQFFEGLFSERHVNPGVFLGDLHGVNEIQYALQNEILPALAKNGTKILFLEMVRAEDQRVLERFQRDGDINKLGQYFKDNGWGNKGGYPDDRNGAWVDQLVNTCAVARRLGINLFGIDVGHSGRTRLETANLAWRDTVLSTLAKYPKGVRYAVFGGCGHSGDYPQNKGVDRLLNIPSVDFAAQQEGGSINIRVGRFGVGDGRGSDYIYRIKSGS